MRVSTITVVTVCLNARDSIRITMESVVRQTFDKIEHVIIDGGSRDGTQDIVNEYPLGYFVSEKDNGVYDAMDKGALVSSGDILIFLNAGDSFYDNNVCKDVASLYLKSEADIVFGNLMPVYLKSNDTHDHCSFEEGKVVDLGYLNNRRQLYDESIHHQTTFYRRWIFNKCSFKCCIPEATGEYNVLLNATMNHNAVVKHIDRIIVRFALGGISTKQFPIEWNKYIKAREILRKLYCPDKENIKVHSEFEFVDGRISKQREMMAYLKNKSKQLIKRSIFFKIYDRIANSIALRVFNLIMPSIYKLQEDQTRRLFNDLSYTIDNKLKSITEVKVTNLITSVEELKTSLAQQKVSFNELALHQMEENNKHQIDAFKYQQLLSHLNINLSKIFNNTKSDDVFSSYGYSVYSQWDEDGLIQYLVSRINFTDQTFVEIGVGDYNEANTRLLLEKDNWSGLIVDCDSSNIEKIRNNGLYWKYSINAVNEFVDRDNINQLLIENNMSGEIGLLSIDVDGIDYWIWNAITVISPIIVICEYNGIFGSKAKVTVPYDKRFVRSKKHYSCLYAGASIKALTVLGNTKGYTFIGTNNGGNNAFFVRNDKLESSRITPSKFSYTRPMFRESRNPDGTPSYLDISESISLIKDMDVYDLDKKSNVKIGEIPVLFD